MRKCLTSIDRYHPVLNISLEDLNSLNKRDNRPKYLDFRYVNYNDMILHFDEIDWSIMYKCNDINSII